MIPASIESVPAIIRLAEKPQLAASHPHIRPAIGFLPTATNAIAASGGITTVQVSEAIFPHVPINAITYGIITADTLPTHFLRTLSTRPTCSHILIPIVMLSTSPSEAKPLKFVVILVRNHVRPFVERRFWTTTSEPSDGFVICTPNTEHTAESTPIITNNPINIVNGVGSLLHPCSIPLSILSNTYVFFFVFSFICLFLL
mgnify:CR=1 FL=1